MHSLMHTKRSESNFWFKCLKPNCKSTFQYQLLLDLHMRIHNNQHIVAVVSTDNENGIVLTMCTVKEVHK